MIQLPEDFCKATLQTLGSQRYERLMEALQESAPVSIRTNPRKAKGWTTDDGGERVAWCDTGYYLTARPQFTFDPLLHAGVYYVQEAASMFVAHVLQSLMPREKRPVAMLDLCAAPGGKSTALLSVAHPDSLLVSNEPLRQRAQVLTENIIKWSHPNCIVTNNYPRDFRKTRLAFDVILCDVPCSGEGMFRKDEGAIAEWSIEKVRQCASLQRDIVGDIWPLLRPGGLLIYSTCTLNLQENEENILWILQQLDAELLTIPTLSEWGITGSLHPEVPAAGVCRFIPGLTQGEGLFMAALRKKGEAQPSTVAFDAYASTCRQHLQVLHAGVPESCQKGKTIVPAHALAMATTADATRFPQVALTWQEAIRYLRGEALTLSRDIPCGFVIVTYEGHPLGFVKHIGSRANNLYPDAWRIKSSHLPDTPPRILTREHLIN